MVFSPVCLLRLWLWFCSNWRTWPLEEGKCWRKRWHSFPRIGISQRQQVGKIKTRAQIFILIFHICLCDSHHRTCGATVDMSDEHLSAGTFAVRKSRVEVLKGTNWNVRTWKPGKLSSASALASVSETAFWLSIVSNVSCPLFCLSKAFMEDGGQLSSANNRLSDQWRWGHGWHGDYSHRSPSGATMLAIHCNEGLFVTFLHIPCSLN